MSDDVRLLGFFGIQIGLLVIYYGDIIKLPFWLVWFPTIVIFGGMVLVFLVGCIILAKKKKENLRKDYKDIIKDKNEK